MYSVQNPKCIWEATVTSEFQQLILQQEKEKVTFDQPQTTFEAHFSDHNQQNLGNGRNVDVMIDVRWPEFICPWPKGNEK